jgi:hypothetical protein
MMSRVLEANKEYMIALIHNMDNIIATGKLNVLDYTVQQEDQEKKMIADYFMEILEYFQYCTIINLELFVMMDLMIILLLQHVMNFMEVQ